MERRSEDSEKEAFKGQNGKEPTELQDGFLSLVLESLPYPFYVIDASTYRVRVANPAAHFGRLSEDTTCHALTHNSNKPCGSAEHPCPVESVKKTKQPVTVEHLHLDEQGNARKVQVHATPMLDTEGDVSQIIVTSLDITERRELEHALQIREEQYRSLVETMNEGFTMVDENQVRTYANKRLCEMLGYAVDEIVGSPATSLFDETNKKKWEKEFAKRKKGKSGAYEIAWTSKDGEKIPTILSPRPVFDEKGNFKGSFSVITNISGQKLTEQALRDREKALEIQTINLEEANTALRVLLQRRDEDRTELEEKVFFNVRQLIEPYVEKLNKSELDDRQKAYISVLESNLKEIVEPFSHRLSHTYLKLTPTEIQVANLIRQGKTTKEIAELLNLSSRTIESHRKNIRKKMGLKDKKENLRSHLLSLQ